MKYATIRKTVSRLIVASFVGIGILYGGSRLVGPAPRMIADNQPMIG